METNPYQSEQQALPSAPPGGFGGFGGVPMATPQSTSPLAAPPGGFGGFGGVPTASPVNIAQNTQVPTLGVNQVPTAGPKEAKKGFVPTDPYDYESIIGLVQQVESGSGYKEGKKIYGDKDASGNPKAFGPLQIHPSVVQDVNRIYKKNFTHEQMHDLATAQEVFKLYIDYYASEKRLGRPPTNEDVVRIWNGGPNGYKKSSTDGYLGKYMTKSK